jgi:dienelactone hydrolase
MVTPSATAFVSPVTFDPAEMERRYLAALPLFGYDDVAPLELQTVDSTRAGSLTVEEIEYASSTGKTVTGLLVSNLDAGAQPAMIMLPPFPAADLLDRALEFAHLGIVVLVIDAPQVRRGGDIDRFLAEDRDEMIELMVELRRGVDLLIEKGVDPERLAFWGYSWGCAMGSELAGIEHRIGSYVLMHCEGGAVEHFAGPDDADGPLTAIPVAQRDAWVAAMEPIEPLYFIGHAAPSALLLQAGTRDEEILRSDAERLHEAASDPKDVRWYDSTHDPAPEEWCDMAAWLGERLSLESSRIPECG